MALNQFFTKYDNPTEQDLLQDLLVEAIQQMGVDIYYLPRVIADQSDIFGEDPLGSFDTAVKLEAYVKTVEGWEGEGDILTQIGLQMRDRVTFTITQRRWDEIKTEKLLNEDGNPIYLESSNTSSPTYSDQGSIMLETGSANGYSLTTRPLEGDLIYLPLVSEIFQIRFVEHEQLFYSMGKLMTYDLICEKWDYSSERLDTGISDIDNIEVVFSTDVTDDRILLETDGAVLMEDGISYLLLESGSARIEDVDAFSNNEILEIEGADFIDFSERHPFLWGKTDF